MIDFTIMKSKKNITTQLEEETLNDFNKLFLEYKKQGYQIKKADLFNHIIKEYAKKNMNEDKAV